MQLFSKIETVPASVGLDDDEDDFQADEQYSGDKKRRHKNYNNLNQLADNEDIDMSGSGFDNTDDQSCKLCLSPTGNCHKVIVL